MSRSSGCSSRSMLSDEDEEDGDIEKYDQDGMRETTRHHALSVQ